MVLSALVSPQGAAVPEQYVFWHKVLLRGLTALQYTVFLSVLHTGSCSVIAHLHGRALPLGRCLRTTHKSLQHDRPLSVYGTLFGSVLKLSNAEAMWLKAVRAALCLVHSRWLRESCQQSMQAMLGLVQMQSACRAS